MREWLRRIIEPMFDSWESSDEYATLHRLDREVRVDVARIFPSKAKRKDELPMWDQSVWVAPSANDGGAADRLDTHIERRLAGARGDACDER